MKTTLTAALLALTAPAAYAHAEATPHVHAGDMALWLGLAAMGVAAGLAILRR